MGLTIHFDLKTKETEPRKIKKILEQARELARDLPFEEVTDVQDLRSQEAVRSSRAGRPLSLVYPWNKRISCWVYPARTIGFRVWPGEGAEDASFSLSCYPENFELEYHPKDDRRFLEPDKDGFQGAFDWGKWKRHVRRQNLPLQSPVCSAEKRLVPTKAAGWSGHDFCKTQYASAPACGGLANFLRCHITMITFLERAGKIPGLKVSIDDEGHYGRANYSDDYREANAAGRKPTYVWHEGKHDPKALANEIGEWNVVMAAMVGAMDEAMTAAGIPTPSVSPIKDFANFEQLEFRGCNHPDIKPFLEQMRQVATQTAAKIKATAAAGGSNGDASKNIN